MDEGELSIIKRKAGRPSLSSSHQTSEGLTTISNSKPYVKESHIIYQVPGSSVSKVELEATEKYMLEVPRKLQDKRFIRRLTEVIKADDAVAIDVVYVNRCWANATSKVCPRQEKDDSINRTLSEIQDKNFEKKKERKKEKRKKKRKERKKERVAPRWTDVSGPRTASFLFKSCMYYSMLILHNPIKPLNVMSTNSFSWASNFTSSITCCINELRRLELVQ